MSDFDKEEFYREEAMNEARLDAQADYLNDGICPVCKEHCILKETVHGEIIYVCNDCGAVFE